MRKMLTLMVLLLALALAVACTPAANIDSGEGEGVGAGDHEALVESLEGAGLEITEDNVLLDSFFAGTVGARFLTVNEQMIQIFEFADESAAAAAAETVNATGTIIGNATVDWVETPYFYRRGSLVVVYAGEDPAILDALSGALGEPFLVGAGGFIQE